MTSVRMVCIAACVTMWMSGTLLCAQQQRPLTVWLIPSEEAEVRAASDSFDITEEIRKFNQSRQDGLVRVLNTLRP